MRRAGLPFHLLLLSLLAVDALNAQATFRSGTSAVEMRVSVHKNGRAVLGLRAADFQVRDRSVLQQVETVSTEHTGLDITLLLDVSGSVSSSLEPRLVNCIKTIGAAMAPDDRTAVWTFGSHIESVAGWPPDTVRTDGPFGDGGTSVFDAAVMAAMQPARPNRSRLIVALTDGLDNSSFTPRAARLEVLRRADVVLEIVVFSIAGRTLRYNVGPVAVGDYDYLLRELSDATGGDFLDVRTQNADIEPVRRAMSALRTSYILTYKPKAEDAPGWHPIEVLVKGSRDGVIAKPGYFVGASTGGLDKR